MTRLGLLIASALALASCAGAPKPPPEPVVQIVEVKLPVPVRCAPDLGPDPAYADTDDALAAVDIFDAVKLLLAGRGQRIARDAVKTAALEGCRAVPDVPPRPG